MKLKILLLLTLLFCPLAVSQQSSSESSFSVAAVLSEPATAAQSSSSEPTTAKEALEQPPSGDEWVKLIESLGGLQGASTLAIVLVAVQLIMLLLRSKVGDYTGQLKMVLVLFFTMVGGVISLKLQGMDWPAVFAHSGTLAMFQVFANQVYKQFFVKTS